MKESYMAQNSLELKFPSGSSPPFYTKQRTCLTEEKAKTVSLKKKMDIKFDYAQLPTGPRL